MSDTWKCWEKRRPIEKGGDRREPVTHPVQPKVRGKEVVKK